MKKQWNKPALHLLVLVLVTLAIIAGRYRPIFENLDAPKTSEVYRDGIKTVLNAIYHAKYNDSYTWFGGMNYPYREHIMAATELPGLALLYKAVYPHWPGIINYAFGIVHLVLLLSMLLGVVFIYLNLRELGLPYYWAMPFAIAVAFLSPQNMRFVPHMGLAPLFVIPAALYFLLKYDRTHHWKYAAYLGLVDFVGAFLHFYFFAILALFVSIYFLCTLLETGKALTGVATVGESPGFLKKTARLACHYGLAIGLPALFFYAWMVAGDVVTDRSPNPFGFFSGASNFSNIFSSPQLPLYEWINKDWFLTVQCSFEGWSYVGLVADAFLVALVVKLVIGRFRQPIFQFVPKDYRRYFLKLLLAGSALAFLGCSQPFAIQALEPLLQYTGPLKQFRSTGRFVWAFYYAINILAFSGFYYLTKNIGRQWLRGAVLGCIAAVSLYEAYTFHTSKYTFIDYNLDYPAELEPGHEFTTVTDLDFSKYQAIVPSPLFLIGSSNFERPGSAFVIQQALVLSSQTGLPVTGAMLTRSSHRQGMNQMQLVGEPYRLPAVLEDYPNDKPLLLLDSYTEDSTLQAQFRHLKDGARLLHQSKWWCLYELPLQSFHDRIEQRKKAIVEVMASGTLHPLKGLWSTAAEEDFVRESFDERASPNAYRGGGCYRGVVGKANTLFEGRLPHARTDTDYSLHLWVDVVPDRFSVTEFKVSEQLPSGEVKVLDQRSPFWNAEVFDSNGWVLLEMGFRLHSPDSMVTLSFKKGEDYDLREISVDELLIKPAGTDLYQAGEGYVWKNNRWYQ